MLVILMTIIGSCGAYFFKKSADKTNGIMALMRTPAFYLGGALYAAGAVMNVILLRHMDYTVLYPMTALTYIWSLLISHWFLNERIVLKKIVGIMLICFGVLLLTV